MYLFLNVDLNRSISNSLFKDLEKWSKEPGVFSQTYSELNYWVNESKEGHRLIDTAKMAVKVIDYLLIEKVPRVFIEVYLTFLKKNIEKIGKYLDH